MNRFERVGPLVDPAPSGFPEPEARDHCNCNSNKHLRAMGFALGLAIFAICPIGSGAAAAIPDAAAARLVTAGALAPASAGPATASLPVPPALDPERQALAEFTPARRTYVRVRQALALVEPLILAAAGLWLAATGRAARLRDAARRLPGGRYVRTLVVVAAVLLLGALVDLPIALFRDWYWEHRFGLSNQSLGAWGIEQAESLLLAIAALGASGLVAGALWIEARFGRRAWIVLGAALLPVLITAVFLSPLVVEPVFNRFEPLHDPALAQRIMALAARAGVPTKEVVQVDRSRQTNAVNAYVSGFGPSRRVVIWDTTLGALAPDELLFVVGHELGHDRLRHLWKGVLAGALGDFAALFALDRSLRAVLGRRGGRWRIASLADEAVIPLAAALLIGIAFLAQPAANAVSREIEHEADGFGLELTHDNAAAARAFLVMGRITRSDPDPPRWIEWMLYTHPTLLQRIRFAERWHPWTEGRPNRYFRAS